MFSVLIFDLDGTLIDSRADIALSVNLALRDLGLPLMPVETIYGYVGNGVYRLITDATGSQDPDFLDHALKIFEGHYLAHLTDHTRLYPGMEEVLGHYRDRTKVVVTNKRAKFTRKIMEDLGVADRFELLISGDEVGQLKPHPAMIWNALERLNRTPQEAVVIGDMHNDIQAARSAGVRVCAVGYGLSDAKMLKEADPDFFAETVGDLITLPF